MRKAQIPPIGGRLREQRIAGGKDLTTVASALGISGPSLSAIELGKRQPSLNVLCLLAQEYQISLRDLLSELPVDRDPICINFANEFAHNLSVDDWMVLRTVALRLAQVGRHKR
jgi:transcriptional regulator with XRE-family HTH domain